MAVYQGLTLALVGQDITQNTSTVSLLWQTTQTAGSYNHYERQATYTVTHALGQEKHTLSYRLQKNSTHPILETQLTVPHAPDGTGFVSVDTWLDTDISAGVVELHQHLDLPTIPRASTLGATDANIGAVSLIAVSRKSDRYTHTIALSFGGISGYLDADGNMRDTPQKLQQTNLSFPVPETFYDEIPNSPSGVCTLTCKTFLENTQIGQDQTARFTITADPALCGPTMTWSVADGSAATELTGDSHIFVRYVSRALCSVNAQARRGATLAGCTAAGREVSPGQILELQDIHGGNIPLRAWDSRGYVTEVVVPLQMVEYIPLSCQATLTRTDPTSGGAILRVQGKYFSGSFGAADNSLALTYQVNGGPAQSLIPTVVEDGYTAQVSLQGLDYRIAHTVTVTARDRVAQVEITASVGKGIPVFDWGENDFTFHVPVQMEQGFTLGGTGLVDLIYPVGSIYLAYHTTDPGILFGGTWQRLYGRFLWAAEAGEAIGTTGGEKTHTLTASEMPRHYHTGVRRADSTVSGGVSAAASAGGNDTDYRTDYAGGGQAHNNMPPYIAVYVWQRTA